MADTSGGPENPAEAEAAPADDAALQETRAEGEERERWHHFRQDGGDGLTEVVAPDHTNSWFYYIGYHTNKQPCKSIWGGIFVVLLFAGGMVNLTYSNDSYDLWSLDGSEGLKRKAIIDTFPIPMQISTILIHRRKDGDSDNMMDKEAVAETLDLWNYLTNSTRSGDDNGEVLTTVTGRTPGATYADVCYRLAPTADCWTEDASFLKGFGGAACQESGFSPGCYNSQMVKGGFFPVDMLFSGIVASEPIQSEIMFADIIKSSTETVAIPGLGEVPKVEQVSAFRIFLGTNMMDLLDYEKASNEYAWMKEASDYIAANADKYPHITVSTYMGRDLNDAVDSLVSSDTPLLITAFVLVGVFVAVFSSHRWTLTGMKSIFASYLFFVNSLVIAATLGLTSMWGGIWASPHLLMGFAFSGVGADNLILLSGGLEELDHGNKEIAHLMGEVYVHAMPTIAFANVTTVAALLCGALVPIKGNASICVFGAVGFAFMWFICFFVIGPLVGLEVARERRGEISGCCCLYWCSGGDPEFIPIDPPADSPTDAAPGPSRNDPAEIVRSASTLIHHCVKQWYLYLISHPLTCLFLVIATCAFTFYCWFIAIDPLVGFPIDYIIPENTSVSRYFEIVGEYKFLSILPWQFVVPNVDFSKRLVRDQYLTLIDGLDNTKNTVPYSGPGMMSKTQPTGGPLCFDKLSNFVTDLQMYAMTEPTAPSLAHDVDPSEFDRFLDKFLADQRGLKWIPGIIRHSETDMTLLSQSMCKVFFGGVGPGNAIAIADQVYKDTGFPRGFAYFNEFIYGEVDEKVPLLTFYSIIACTALMGIIILMVTPIYIGVLTVTMIAMINICMMAILTHMGVYLNAVTFVGICLAVTVQVDYSVHVADVYYQNNAISDPFERLLISVMDIDAPLAKAAGSTAIGMSMLLLTSNLAMRTFGKMLVLTIFLALYFAVIMLPACLLVFSHIAIFLNHELDKPDDKMNFLTTGMAIVLFFAIFIQYGFFAVDALLKK